MEEITLGRFITSETLESLPEGIAVYTEGNILPSPLSKQVESLDDTTAGMPGEIKLDPSGKLLKEYIRYDGGTTFLLEGYNRWVYNILPRQIEATAFDMGGGRKMYLKNIVYTRPTMRGKPYWPSDVRRDTTDYQADMYGEPVIITADGTEEKGKQFKYVKVTTIFVMLGSILCHLYQKTDEEKLQMGECPQDPLGYFVARGSEKVILIQEKLRMNKPILYNKDKEILIKMTNEVISGSSSTILGVKDGEEEINIRVRFMGKKSSEKSKQEQHTLGVMQAFQLLEVPGFEENFQYEITEAICSFVRPEWRRKVQYVLWNSFIKLFRYSDVYEYIRHEIKTGDSSKPREETKRGRKSQKTEESSTKSEERVDVKSYEKEIFRNSFLKELFPQIPIESYEKGSDEYNASLVRKMYMLAFMTARLAEYIAGFRKLDDRDSWSIKRLESAPRMMEHLFRMIWTKSSRTTQDKINENMKTSPSKDPFVAFNESYTGFSEIGDTFSTSFTTMMWGLKGYDGTSYRENIVEQLKRESVLSTYSHLSRIRTPTSGKVKKAEVRYIQQSQHGYIDHAETPESSKCGIVKSLAIGCYITIARDENILDHYIFPPKDQDPEKLTLRESLGEVFISNTPSPEVNTSCFVNGKIMGWCQGERMKDYCVGLRRQTKLPKDMCIYYNRNDRVIEFYTDAARMVRPLLVVEQDEKTGKRILTIEKKDLWKEDMATLIREGCIEYLDSLEIESPHILIAQSTWSMETAFSDYFSLRDEVTNERSKLETLKQGQMYQPLYGDYMEPTPENIQAIEVNLDSNLLPKMERLRKYTEFTHAEMDPASVLGWSASYIPFANHNMASKNTYQCKMGREAMSIYHTNHMTRFDGTIKTLAFPSRPIVETTDFIGMNMLPNGKMVQVMITPYGGWNQEDAFIYNKDSIDRGLFMYVKYTELKSISKRSKEFEEEFARPPHVEGQPTDKYINLDERGIARIGSYMKVGDIWAAKKRNFKDKESNVTRVSYEFSKIGIGDEGIVDRIYVSQNRGKDPVVRMVIREVRSPEVGDKFTSRSAQKRTIGRILPSEDMPFNARGERPDIIVNPHAIPSRMTIGKIIEIIASKVGAITFEKQNATSFRSVDIENLKRTLHAYGYSSSGKEAFYNGITGKLMKAPVFFGPCYNQALKHHVADKIQARAKGTNFVSLTRQPNPGRKKGGGLRFGEMERDALLSHGAGAFTKERFCTVSDAYKMIICTTCGRFAFANFMKHDFECKYCGERGKFGRQEIPWIFNVFVEYLHGMGFDVRFTTSNNNMTVRDDFDIEDHGEFGEFEEEF